MARIKIKNKNSLPKGFTVRKGKCVKTYEAGGATVSTTLSGVDREAANLEAEKGEMVLTDTSGDGVFELYDVGGKRHSEGGTALNLPDQSFVYSDTRGMLLTKDEMKSLGIDQKKRITPAKAAKKFPLNKYIEILEDNTSDKIAVETAEQMINKNKIMLSQIAFIQESKKDFENGLPLAAFPYLMSKGVNPEEFQQKIDQINAEKNAPQQGMSQGTPTHTMPDGTVMPGATHGEGMGMMQGAPPMGPPQGMLPPQPPTAGQAEQMVVAEDGLETAPLGRSLFGGFKRSSYNVAPVENTVQDADNEETHLCPAYGNPPPSAAMKHAADINNNYKGPGGNNDSDKINRGLGPGFRYGGDLMAYQTQGEFVDKDGKVLDRDSLQLYEDMPKPNRPIPNNIDSIMQRAGLQLETQKMLNEVEGDIEFDLATKCKNQLCTYDEWRFAYRLKDIKEVRFMYESYKTKAIDKMKASGTDTEIMPGHENMLQTKENIPQYRSGGTYYEDEGKGLSTFVQGGAEIGGSLRKFVYGGQDNAAGVSISQNTDIQLDPVIPSYTNNPSYRALHGQLMMLQNDHSNAIRYHQENPHMFKEGKAQEEFEKQIDNLQSTMRDIELQMRNIQRQDVLKGSIIDIASPTPNVQIANTQQYTGTNPAVQNMGMMMARNGMELPKADVGQPICTGDNCSDTDEHNDRKHTGRQTGRDAHMNFQNHIMSDDFTDIRKGWFDAYNALVTQWDEVADAYGGKQAMQTAIDGGKLSKKDKRKYQKILKNEPVRGKTQEQLFDAFMDMNDKLNQASAAGYTPNDFANAKKDGKFLHKRYQGICEELGWGDCESNKFGNENTKMFQGMFTAMQHLKNSESDIDNAEAFFGNIQTDLSGEHHGGGAHIDEFTKLPMSDIDGKIGKTTAGQFMTASNEIYEEEIITEIECDEAMQLKISAECREKGQDFDLTKCACKTTPDDPETPDTPPYMTFPQDDLRLQNAIDQKWSRNLYMPTRQNMDPAIPDVAYQDPQAMIQANLSMAQQMAKADPQNAAYYMGQISDKINKGISDVANTNVKIFDNNEARVSGILNDAALTNAGYRDEYNTRYATALNNFDNTMVADNANIVDVQVDRMDHADKLYAINTEHPNFYYDAQGHMNQYYNPQDIFADRSVQDQNITMSGAHKECKDMGFEDNTPQMNVCIKQRLASNNPKSTNRADMYKENTDINDDDETTEENARHGLELGCTSCGNNKRRKELARSQKALRKWIFGVK
jgi:hypothetical protein